MTVFESMGRYLVLQHVCMIGPMTLREMHGEIVLAADVHFHNQSVLIPFSYRINYATEKQKTRIYKAANKAYEDFVSAWKYRVENL